MAVFEITTENFEKEVLGSDLPVLVDFWASWCAPCRMLSPTVDEIAEEYEGTIRVGKVNVDEQVHLASQYRIVSIPTLMLFEGGQVKKTLIGVYPKDPLLRELGL